MRAINFIAGVFIAIPLALVAVVLFLTGLILVEVAMVAVRGAAWITR